MNSSGSRTGLSPYVILTGLCSSRMFLYLSLQSYPALIPILQKEWQMSNTAAGSIVSVYQVGFLISLMGLSVLTDWISTKKVYLYSAIAIAESPVFSSGLTEVVSPDYLGTAYGLRSLIGFGAGAISPTVFGLILDVTNAGQTNASGYIPNWGWAFSMLGFVALSGPWMMFKLRAMPESLKMAGGKR